MATVSVPSGDLEYVEKGNGLPLVMLHGGTGSIDEWGSCVDALSSAYRVIAYNRRGYGYSTPRSVFPADYYEEDIQDLLDLMDVMGIDPPVFFCGFSDGGTIALMLAARYPDYCKAMVVSGAHIYVEDKTTKGLLEIRRYYEKLADFKGSRDTAQYRSQTAWFDRWLGDAFFPFSIRHELSRITCPTLVVQGTEDEFASDGHAEDIARAIPNSQLWLVNGARHWVHGGVHRPVFEQRVVAFLQEHH